MVGGCIEKIHFFPAQHFLREREIRRKLLHTSWEHPWGDCSFFIRPSYELRLAFSMAIFNLITMIFRSLFSVSLRTGIFYQYFLLFQKAFSLYEDRFWCHLTWGKARHIISLILSKCLNSCVSTISSSVSNWIGSQTEQEWLPALELLQRFQLPADASFSKTACS